VPERRADSEGDVTEGTILWEPSAERISRSRLSQYARWLEANRGLVFGGYDDLWRWSVGHVEEFWRSIREHFGVQALGQQETVLEWGVGAEGARWFPGARLNYVDQFLGHPPDDVALVECREDESRPPVELTYGELFVLAGAAANGLRRLGVAQGDRVVSVLPNSAAAVVAFLATVSLGAIWSSCAPEFGAQSMVDRFRQVRPKVLVSVSDYRYAGRTYDMSDKIEVLESSLPGLAASVVVGTAPRDASKTEGSPKRIGWDDLLCEKGELTPVRVDFSHPLWILYSSGTTGLPKAIVHGHGGIVLEHLKALAFHSDLRRGDRFFWFTTTGWMMWNFLVGGLLVGSTIVCYDGDPLWPDPERLWRLASSTGITYFGTSAPYLEACRRSGLIPRRSGPLAIHSVGSTGAPLSPEGFAWAASQIGDDVLVGSVSGGTDVCTAFLASCPWLEVRAGELQCRALGAEVEAFDEKGEAVVGEVGELVVTKPMPSMPVSLWDDDGARLHASYFAHFPHLWRHGDWVKITLRGSAVVYGRSDATLNRGGVRMGTAEFYRVVESLPQVSDALVVDTSELGRKGELILFVVPAHTEPSTGAAKLGESDEREIRAAIRENLSPRHVPDRVVAVPVLPRTINGKKLEVPVRRIVLGADPSEVISRGALSDPEAIDALLDALSGAARG
jgi:acetoacetyl-CoA synthetase